MITIYEASWCPYCIRVREWISDNLIGVPIVFIAMPRDKAKRQELVEVSGQPGIPTMVDEETNTVIPDDDDKIIEYLSKKYNKILHQKQPHANLAIKTIEVSFF